jgi:phosphoenolpyruvate phosphomutase
MRALILAAGIGSRLGETAGGLPKTLVPVGDMPILGRILHDLLAADIHDIVIATGYQQEHIHAYIDQEPAFKPLRIRYVHNPRFAETNYIYSMWLARQEIAGDDLLSFHGDMVYDSTLLTRLLGLEGSAVFVQRRGPLPEKDFKARVQNGRVMEIGVNVFGEDAHACMPVYKLSAADFALWMERIDQYIQREETRCYAEDALNEVSGAIDLAPLYYQDELCMEVDTEEDLHRALGLLRL